MNVTSLVVTTLVGGMLITPTANLMTATLNTRALMEATVLYDSAVDTAQLEWSQDNQNFSYTPPTGCTEQDDSGYNNLGYLLHIKCAVGHQSVGSTPIQLAYPPNQQTGGLGIYTDQNRDGYDDVTGLPTHYYGCYSGWSGTGGTGSSGDFQSNKCTLGGPLVIPAYSGLYS